MPSTAILAAHQGQNRSRGRPFRSASVMTLMPFSSTDRVSLGRTATSVAIAPLPTYRLLSAHEMLLPAGGSELLQFLFGRARGRPGSRYGVSRRPVGEEDGVRPAHSTRESGEVGADVHVAGAAAIDGLHRDRWNRQRL